MAHDNCGMTDKEKETLESDSQIEESADLKEAGEPRTEEDVELGADSVVVAEGESQGEESPEPDTPIELSREAWEELTRNAAKADEYYDRLTRERAELENFKKRASRDRQEAVKYANEALVETLLPIMDNFEMAVLAMKNTEGSKELETLKVGVEMIQGQMKNALSEVGLEEINAEGAMFDPKIHEALSQEESDEKPEGTVLSQSRKGYRLRDRLVRPASVVVAKKPGTENSEGSGAK